MLEFRRVRTQERLGPLTLDLEVIPSLDEAMDQLCAELERRGLTRDPRSFDLCPYFGVVWPAARALCLALVARGERLCGATALEIGCGLALPALVAARLGAAVTATDFHPEVPRFLEVNQRLNEVVVDYVSRDWREPELQEARYDLVLASDLLYDPSHALPVARTLARRCAPGGRVLLADPGRPYLDDCLRELGRLGFQHRLDVATVAGTAQLGGVEGRVEVFVVEGWRPGE